MQTAALNTGHNETGHVKFSIDATAVNTHVPGHTTPICDLGVHTLVWLRNVAVHVKVFRGPWQSQRDPICSTNNNSEPRLHN